MLRNLCLCISLGLLLATLPSPPRTFEPYVLVYAGKMVDYGAALAAIVNETGTKAIVAHDEDTMRAMITLPQIRCVVISVYNPPEFSFLKDFAPVLQAHFEEGGAFIGIGPVCSRILADPLATGIFPVRGNLTGRGTAMEGRYGSAYVLSEPVEGISDNLPPRFVLTQGQYVYDCGTEGPLEPTSEDGDLQIVYREESTGIPMVIALETPNGARSISLAGCYVADVERLTYYWKRLVEQEEFRSLLKGCVSWAMNGSRRYAELGPSAEDRLKAEADAILAAKAKSDLARRRAGQRRTIPLGLAWTAAIAFQAFLVMKYIAPRFRPQSDAAKARRSHLLK